MSDKIIEIVATIKDKNGVVTTTVTSSKEIPSFDDFDKLGFRTAFHELEGAVLETSKEVNTRITESILSIGSKKKSSKPNPGSTPKKVK